MNNLILVAIGGSLGSVLRYAISIILPFQGQEFPKATFITNVLASLLLGFISGLLISKLNDSLWLKYFLAIGVCGGFSTFSTYIFDFFKLQQNNLTFLALTYIVASVIVSIIAIFIGYSLTKFF